MRLKAISPKGVSYERRGCMRVGSTYQVPLEAGARSVVVQRAQVSKLHEDQGFCDLPLNLKAGSQTLHDVQTDCAMPLQHFEDCNGVQT